MSRTTRTPISEQSRYYRRENKVARKISNRKVRHQRTADLINNYARDSWDEYVDRADPRTEGRETW